jgi:hypothetical protein
MQYAVKTLASRSTHRRLSVREVRRYAIEISLPDQPGALGAVASRIGELGGDVVDIDILDHGRGRARDEITVDLADDATADRIGEALSLLGGVTVEHLSPVVERGPHPPGEALDVADALVAESSELRLLEALVTGVLEVFGVAWVVVVREGIERPLAAAGGVPPAAVTRSGGPPHRLPDGDDQVTLGLGDTGTTLILGREGRPFRNRERRDLSTLGHVAATRLAQLGADD